MQDFVFRHQSLLPEGKPRGVTLHRKGRAWIHIVPRCIVHMGEKPNSLCVHDAIRFMQKGNLGAYIMQPIEA
jgi:hypothetical protein